MSSEIIKFYKTFEERLKEYSLILNKSNSTILPPSQVSNAWSNYIELCLISQGWNALWYILRKYCDELQISFPQVVLVKVNSVNFQELTANVTIICDDIGDDDDNDEKCTLPSKFESVPLKDLYVTVSQDNTNLDVDTIAESLDQLRIFYHHLWWPWDDDPENEQFDWVSNNLENRLKLYFDKLLGKVHYITGKTIKRLMESGQEIHLKLKNIYEKLSILEDDELFYHTDLIKEMNEYCDELELIKSELRLWEIPQLRKIQNNNIKQKNNKSGILLTMKECSVKDVEEYLLEVLKDFPPETIIKNLNNKLEESLLLYDHHDTILLTNGNYGLTNREYFDFAVTLKGLDQPKPSIFDKNSGWCLFESLADNVVIENITFSLNFSRSVFFIKKGLVRLNSVTVECNKIKSRAIYVYKNATLIANKCTFSNFKEAIICMSGSTIQLIDCIFENNNICLKICKDAVVSITNCDMSQTIHEPIKYEE